MRIVLLFLLVLLMVAPVQAQDSAATGEQVRLSQLGEGWARTSVNAPVFRKNSVVSFGSRQFTAYYDADGYMVLARRSLDSDEWELHRTEYRGDVSDAHNSISIAVDGSGTLHVAWDHHDRPIQYARGVEPGSMELGEPQGMTGESEDAVTYPHFYNLADGGLLFVYREGGSGAGNVLMNRYDVASEAWEKVQHPLIYGEGERNAYFNKLAIDSKGGWHLSWNWRETWDVATNHDMAYAFSPDEGETWLRSTGEEYALPITAGNAEVVREISQGSELINQTSMAVDAEDRPMVATYWRPEGTEVPQYQLIWYGGAEWHTSQIGEREMAFSLSGGGTRRIPIARPQVVADDDGGVHVVFRDEERGGGITVATSRDEARTDWYIREIYEGPVGQWEPTYDPVVWKREGELHLFHQFVGQGQAETEEDVPPQQVSILEWIP